MLELLEPLREELEHQRARGLGTLGGNGRGDAAQRAQRKALLSFWKNPSSASYVSSLALWPNSSSRRR